MSVTEITLEEILKEHKVEMRPCVSLVKTDGQKINHIDCTGEVVDDFLVVVLREEGEESRVISRIPLEDVTTWRNRDDYSAQSWRWYGS